MRSPLYPPKEHTKAFGYNHDRYGNEFLMEKCKCSWMSDSFRPLLDHGPRMGVGQKWKMGLLP